MHRSDKCPDATLRCTINRAECFLLFLLFYWNPPEKMFISYLPNKENATRVSHRALHLKESQRDLAFHTLSSNDLKVSDS